MKKSLYLVLLPLLWLCALSSAAQGVQKFTIASFEPLPGDLSASMSHKRLDDNGDLYAIVKVKSSNPEDDLMAYQFDFGMMKSIVEGVHGQELWLYVQRNARNVTIRRGGYELSRQDLNYTLEAGRAYELILRTTAAPVYTQMVKFTVTPAISGAVVMYRPEGKDGAEELFGNTQADGTVAKSLPLGTYIYRVMATNYYSSEGRITLNDRKTIKEENVKLRANFSDITLQVASDADIYVNGELKGHRTWTGPLKSGTYQVECRQDKHRSSSEMIVVKENDNRTLTLTPPTPITGTLSVTSNPSGADISIDGTNTGLKTPQQIDGILIGSHNVSVTRQNYKPEIQNFEIKENQTTSVNIQLSDIAKMTIKTIPTYSQIYINGKYAGDAPYTANMASGDYNLRITRNKYRTLERTVHLDSSNPVVTYVLKRQHQQPSAGYLQVGMQVGSLMAFGGTFGGYISNFNVEASVLMGMGKSEPVYWNYTGSSSDVRPITCEYKPMAYGGKIGYGIVIGTSLRITPQVGLTIVSISSDGGDSKCNVASANVGVRFDYAITSGFGLFAAPELDFAATKSEIYKQLEPLSSKVKAWGNGFNLRAGLSVFF